MKKPKNLGSDKLGFFGVLHTWGRDLAAYHPHVHFVVPGGGVSPDGSKWLQVKPDHLFHPLPAKGLYRKLFIEEIRKAGLYDALPAGVLTFDWVMNRKPVGDGESVLKDMAPYVYRVAISDNRIVSVDDKEVTYRVKPSGKRSYQTRRLGGEAFVRAFAQHILPPDFKKIRYYGFMSPNCKLQLADARWLAWLWRGWTLWTASLLPKPEPRKRQPPKCGRCGGELKLLGITDADGNLLWQREPIVRGPPEKSCSA